MKEILKNKKLIYILISVIILIGIISIFVLRLNFTLDYKENTRINVYLGEGYNIEDIKQIAEETLGKQDMNYQAIEKFGDSIAVTVEQASEEQINNFEAKLKEKYEIDTESEILQADTIPHLRGRDIVKPYIIPMVITTVVILAYVGIRFTNLGIFYTVFTLLFRMIVAEGLFLSFIAILRLPIGVYTMPVALIIYIAVTIWTTVKYQNQLDKKQAESKEK